jgi:hypothetical protein
LAPPWRPDGGLPAEKTGPTGHSTVAPERNM